MFTIPPSLPLNLLPTERRGDEEWAWDPIRKKHILMTPEEWVRQNLVHYLLNEIKVPRGLLSMERGLKYNNLQKRYDLVAWDRKGKPALLCECKSPFIELDQNALQQLFVYNSQLETPRVILTNGKKLMLFEKKPDGVFQENNLLPEFWK